MTEKKQDTYPVWIRCTNCQCEAYQVEIPWGTYVEKHLAGRPCPGCGCSGTLMRTSKGSS